ncbi:MAG: hypothetical protein ACOYIR_02865 [Christensenellales bacterium]|jgi:hypothetical protein
MEYTGRVSSPLLNGEATLCVEENGLALITPFEAHQIPYADVNAFELRNYAVHIMTEAGTLTINGLGNACEPFYDELYAAYNNKVRKALFVKGRPLFKAKGEYRYVENGVTAKGSALIEVYGDCVLVLPQTTEARRVPLCFVKAVEKGPFELTLRLNTGESYTLSKLGYDTAPFEDTLAKQLKILSKKALDHVKALDPSLGIAQASAIAKLMLEGVAARVGELASIAPSFVRELEKMVKESRSAESYAVLKTLCAPDQIYVGILRRFGQHGGTDTANEEADDEVEPAPDENGEETNMVWMIAPGGRGGVAAVEFAVAEDESAATFIYRFQGDFDAFSRAFNRALEAIAFKREVIRLKDDELKRPEYADYAMAIKRNAALRFVRSCFAGRVIHSSPERWKQGMIAHLGKE